MADMICTSCSGRFYETTKKFNPNKTLTGDMLVLKSKHKNDGWSTFYEDVSCPTGDMSCPECGNLYTNSGGIRVDLEQYDNDSNKIPRDRTCPVCQRQMSARGLKNHIKYKHPDYNG